MILQRLAQDLKQRDWGAALIEVAIVVVGIFIGLQVDAWNDGRNDRIAEREYLQRLHADVERLLPLQQDRMEMRLEYLDRLGDAADLFFAGSADALWSDAHCRAVANSHIFSPLPTAFPVLNEMLSTGAVGLIRDVRLRDALSELQIHVSRSEELVSRLSRDAMMISRVYPEAIREEAEPAVEPGERHADRPICNLAVIRSNPTLLNDLVDNYSRYRAYANIGLIETHELYRRVHVLLDEALGITHQPEPVPLDS